MTTPEVSESTCAVRSASIAEVVERWTATGPVRASTTLTGVGAGSSASAAASAGLGLFGPSDGFRNDDQRAERGGAQDPADGQDDQALSLHVLF